MSHISKTAENRKIHTLLRMTLSFFAKLAVPVGARRRRGREVARSGGSEGTTIRGRRGSGHSDEARVSATRQRRREATTRFAASPARRCFLDPTANRGNRCCFRLWWPSPDVDAE